MQRCKIVRVLSQDPGDDLSGITELSLRTKLVSLCHALTGGDQGVVIWHNQGDTFIALSRILSYFCTIANWRAYLQWFIWLKSNGHSDFGPDKACPPENNQLRPN
jgi:hypothetical protein